ncbi:MAG: hypothetical protein JNL98_29905 [Bryobacterales bacterium]|nr:hypothetical protein [Bryobacterales bacterium]
MSMKTCFGLLFSALLLLGQGDVPSSGPFAKLNWIAGSWSGPVGRAQTEEHWISPSGGAMLGVSRTIAGDRMVAFEFLRIEKRGDDMFYVAQPNGRPPTDFKLTRLTDSEAVFENPQHDHPKVISYRLEGDTLIARIAGDVGGKPKAQEFRLQRKK